MGDWLPIETAPTKDDVLTFGPQGVKVDWYDRDGDEPWLGRPSHWMPLPAPPENVG